MSSFSLSSSLELTLSLTHRVAARLLTHRVAARLLTHRVAARLALSPESAISPFP